MRRDGHKFQFTIDMPRSIVWIAFAESEMMSGWWGEAQLEPHTGGAFRLELRVADGILPVDGQVAQITEPQLLELTAAAFGTLSFSVDELPGGTRGASTTLTVAMDRYPLSTHGGTAPATAVRARWDAHIADLVNLLHGHPVDWDAGESEHGTGW